jgi:hypothetical protein
VPDSAGAPPADTEVMAHGSIAPARVLVAGAGIGGLEAALALRSLAGDRAAVELLEPAPRFRVVPEASARALDGGARSLPLRPLAERAGFASGPGGWRRSTATRTWR